MHKKVRILIETAVLIAILLILVLTALKTVNYAFLSMVFVIIMLVPFFLSFERKRPSAREIVPIAVLSATAALGRVIFAPFPSFKPTSAIVIITGIAFGPQAGFVTGAAAALVSNFFFGQGPFTPWQMFSWGIMGFAAGILSNAGFLKSKLSICIFGFLASFIYGWIMDTWQIIAYLSEINLKSVLMTFAASLYFDAVHAVSTVIFLFILSKTWINILERVKVKYGLMEASSVDKNNAL